VNSVSKTLVKSWRISWSLRIKTSRCPEQSSQQRCDEKEERGEQQFD